MSISAISSVNTQTSSTKKKGGGGPPPEIQAQLDKYGLTAQGSYQADMAAINAAKQAQQGQNGQMQGPQGGKGKPPGGGGPPPEIMAQLQQYGLQPQGSLQADLAAIKEAKASSSQTNSNPIQQMMELFNNQTSNNSSSSSLSSLQQLLGQKGTQTSMSFLA